MHIFLSSIETVHVILNGILGIKSFRSFISALLGIDKFATNVVILKQAEGYYNSTSEYYHLRICYSFYDVCKDRCNIKISYTQKPQINLWLLFF